MTGKKRLVNNYTFTEGQSSTAISASQSSLSLSARSCPRFARHHPHLEVVTLCAGLCWRLESLAPPLMPLSHPANQNELQAICGAALAVSALRCITPKACETCFFFHFRPFRARAKKTPFSLAFY